jgi:drug/metabolite transporter superfamily protein YnfA
MQTGIEITLITNFAATAFCLMIATYLFLLWYRQDTRLYTDLPLMFSLSFVAQTINTMIVGLTYAGILESNNDVFLIRSFVVLFATAPMLGAILHIWLPHYRKYHFRVIAGLVAYWIGALLIIREQATVIMLHTPIMVMMILGLMITFAVTWKTGRLKEVRSELMVVSLLITLIVQSSRVALLGMGLDYLAQIFNAIGTLVAALALANPWYKKDAKPTKVKEDAPAIAPLA